MIVGGSKVIIRARDPIMATRKKLEIMVQRKSANKDAKMLSQTGLYQTTVANMSEMEELVGYTETLSQN